MKETLAQINAMIGTYVGEGTNHEGQPFTGCLELQSLLGGRGFHLGDRKNYRGIWLGTEVLGALSSSLGLAP